MRVSQKAYTGATADSKGIFTREGHAEAAAWNVYRYGRLRFIDPALLAETVLSHPFRSAAPRTKTCR